jgi:hypothetical protein
LLAVFALRPALPDPETGRHARDYYTASAPPNSHQLKRALPAAVLDGQTTGDCQTVPTFTKQSISQLGAQLYSGSIATATPQTFTMASPPLELHGFGVDQPIKPDGHALHTDPISTRLEAGFAVTKRRTLVHSRYTF